MNPAPPRPDWMCLLGAHTVDYVGSDGGGVSSIDLAYWQTAYPSGFVRQGSGAQVRLHVRAENPKPNPKAARKQKVTHKGKLLDAEALKKINENQVT